MNKSIGYLVGNSKYLYLVYGLLKVISLFAVFNWAYLISIRKNRYA
uniref:Uncharacterized protein n=1 Tax=Myoviridae sp. ctByu2 TaxID=2827668 RepID=A0A8S5SAI7_9CAUD|nr:MAG TPA: hypothetical protein [Myoviridae sp. ctByu2]